MASSQAPRYVVYLPVNGPVVSTRPYICAVPTLATGGAFIEESMASEVPMQQPSALSSIDMQKSV